MRTIVLSVVHRTSASVVEIDALVSSIERVAVLIKMEIKDEGSSIVMPVLITLICRIRGASAMAILIRLTIVHHDSAITAPVLTIVDAVEAMNDPLVERIPEMANVHEMGAKIRATSITTKAEAALVVAATRVLENVVVAITVLPSRRRNRLQATTTLEVSMHRWHLHSSTRTNEFSSQKEHTHTNIGSLCRLRSIVVCKLMM